MIPAAGEGNGNSRRARGKGIRLKSRGAIHATMKIVHQCLVCGKAHKTEEDAMKCHDGPIQSFQKGVTTKGLLGN
jgi:hypothetical protein